MQSSSIPSVLWDAYIHAQPTQPTPPVQPTPHAPQPTEKSTNGTESYNVIAVPSMIHVPNAPFSYFHRRSVFTDKQRLEQTLETFRSIREKIPHAYIVLIEGSVLTPEERALLQPHVDYLWDTSILPEVVQATTGPAKGDGEVMQLLSYFSSPHFHTLRPQCASVSKLTGRIRLSNRFQFRAPTHGKPIVKIANGGDRNVCNFGPQSILTIFYTVPMGAPFDTYVKALRQCHATPAFVQGKAGIENFLYEAWLLHTPYEAVPFMGLEGYCAPFGNYYHE